MLLESEVHSAFPMLKQEITYLDTSATALKPSCVIDAMSEFALHEYATVHRAVYQTASKATERYGFVRHKVKEFIHAQHEEEIVFVRGATGGINLLAYSLGRLCLEEGDEVMISQMEHHANIVPWQIICNERKARLIVIPLLESGELDLTFYKRALTSRTKIVSIAHISNVLGLINPIQDMASMAHSVGALFCVDGAQAVGRIPVNVQELGVDFYVFSGHKMYGPTGIGILYGRLSLLSQMPPYETGGDMIKEVSFEKTTFQDPPLKFEAGTPSIIEVIGLGAALDFIESIGVSVIAHHEQELLSFLLKEFSQRPYIQILGSSPKRVGIISFHIPGVHPLDLASLLDGKGICLRSGHLCAQPLLRHYGLSQVLRVSFGVYTTLSDLKKLIHELDRLYVILA